MQYTENHNFKLPDGTDRFNIQNENDNWESMDTLIDEYLPLSAGPDSALTGRLYLDKIMDGTSAQSTGIHIQQNEVNRGSLYSYLYENGSSNADFIALVCRDKSGDILNGIRIYDSGNVTIASGGIGKKIYFKPNGFSSDTGAIYIDTDGMFHNNYWFGTASASSVSLPAAWTKIASITLPTRGLYIVTATISVVGTGTSSTSRCRINLGSDTGQWNVGQDVELTSYGSTYTKCASTSYAFALNSNTYKLGLWAIVSYATTLQATTMTATRIGYY